MSLDKLEFNERALGDIKAVQIVEPSLLDVQEALTRMDGRHYSEMNLTAENGAQLTVGGGGGGYLLSMVLPDGSNRTLVNSLTQQLSVDASLVVGGQRAYYPVRYICSLSDAMIAVKTFFELNGPDVDLTWE